MFFEIKDNDLPTRSKNTKGLGEGNLWTLKSDRVPGDYEFDPAGLYPEDAAEQLDMQNKELNNGRLAMIAIAGMTVQELITGTQAF